MYLEAFLETSLKESLGMQNITISELLIKEMSSVALIFPSSLSSGKYFEFFLDLFISLACSESLIHKVTLCWLLEAKFARTVPQLPPPNTEIFLLFMCFFDKYDSQDTIC